MQLRRPFESTVLLTASFQHSVTQHNITQEFLRNRKVLCTFYTTADVTTALAASCGTPQANRNDFYFFCNTGRPEENSTNQSCDYIQPMAVALRNSAIRCIKSMQAIMALWNVAVAVALYQWYLTLHWGREKGCVAHTWHAKLTVCYNNDNYL